MTTLRFRIVNVFARNNQALSGNPLCVFESGENLDDGAMQALARQFNLSETTFILPSASAHARIRIFTPSYEMPFAGHPTLGSAFVCRALGLGGDELRLETQAGVIPVTAQGNRWTLQAVAPKWREVEDTSSIAAALSLDSADIDERPLWVSTGKEQLIVPLRSESAVRNARPQIDGFGRLRGKEAHAAIYIFTPAGEGKLLSRFFFPQDTAVIEDPATGSATANLGGWMIATGRAPCRFEIAQGELARRPSTLRLTVDTEKRIFVGGDVIELARGTLNL
jgi:trans-2,3-dihydro-3-hydroxyanthranilate isomerase